METAEIEIVHFISFFQIYQMKSLMHEKSNGLKRKTSSRTIRFGKNQEKTS